MICMGRVGSSLTSETREGFPEEVRLQLRPIRGKEVGLALRVDPRVMGELERRPKQRFCFTSFVVTETSSKGSLKKRENGFRSCYFLPPQTGNGTEWRKFNVKLLLHDGLIN